MKDAKGHGSDSHSAGIDTIGRSPLGNPMPDLRPETSDFVPQGHNAYYAGNARSSLWWAYQQGHNAYYTGKPESANPHTDPSLAGEWQRSYKVHRKQDKFNATISARRSKT